MAHAKPKRPNTDLSPYFADCRARADGFCRTTFGFRGTLRLHRHALGWDLLRAPVNILLALVYLGQRIIALILSAVRLRRAATWLRARPLILSTDMGVAVERRLLTDLLQIPVHGATPEAQRAAILAAPQLRDVIRAKGSVDDAEQMAGNVQRMIRDYAGTRMAVADMTMAVLTLLLGAALFRALTPGMMSIAPPLAEAIAHETALAAFPLGGWLGSVWYWAFPTHATVWLSLGALTGLVLAAAFISAFAGLIADPVQVWLGIHRRRLNRLINAAEAEVTGNGSTGFAAREHYLARLMDLVDAGASALRHLRG